MRQLLHHLPRVDVRILEHLRHGVDRPDRQLVLREQIERLGARQLLHLRAENGAQLAVVLQAPGHGVEPLVEGEVGDAERAAEVLPLLLVGRADVDEAVLRLERLVGDDGRMPRAETLRRRAGREVALRLIRQRRDQPVEQRDVDALPLAAAMPRQQRQQNPLIRVEARDDVGDRCADLDRLPIRLAGEIDDP